MIQLRPYQQKAVDAVRRKERIGQFRWCLQSPTGSGKTVVLAELLRDPLRQIVFSHRRVLLDQTSAVLKSMGIKHGFIAAGRKANLDIPIQLCMIQTATKRLEKMMHELPKFDRVHVDEGHCQGGPVQMGVFNQCYGNGSNILLYTATPANLGGRIDAVYEVVSIPDLISAGYLAPPVVFGCGQPDTELLEKLRRDAYGEYLAGDVDKLVKPQIIFGRVLEHYRRLNPDGRPFILFAHSVKASIWWAEMLTAKGVPTAHIDGNDVWLNGQFYKSDSETRQKVFRMLESGELKGVSNRFVLREGVDLPCIGHIIVTCPVGSRTVWVQMCGRGLRPFPNKEYCIIQDHGGSSIVHPPLDSDVPWHWELPAGVAEKARTSAMRDDIIPEPIICPQCMRQRPVGDTCPFCGFRYGKHARYVIQANGTLKLIEGKTFRPRKITRHAGQAEEWKKAFWSCRKNGNRTAEQAYANHARMHNWKWLPRDLPLMPAQDYQWFIPLRDIPIEELRK